MNSLNGILLSIIVSLSASAYAGNGDVDSADNTLKSGGFLCVTAPGKTAFDGIYISGNIDGEAQVTNLVIKYHDDYKKSEAILQPRGLFLSSQFELSAIENLEDDSTIIHIKSAKGHGRSEATISIRNGEVVKHLKGVCYVDFKAAP